MINLKYQASPTGAKFHKSKALFRGLMGPIGSGKSVTCCWELYRMAMLQAPNEMGVRKSRWGVIRQCYDDQTEILTENGWKLFRDLGGKEKVAMLDNDKMVFVEPSYHYAADYVGQMVGFEGEGIDFLVTPDHKMYASTCHTRKHIWSDYRLAKAEDLYGKASVRFKRDAGWKGEPVEYTLDQFEWFGFWFAEGHAGESVGNDGHLRRRLCITQTKPEGIEYARDLFARAGIPFNENVRQDGGINFFVPVSRSREAIGDKLHRLLAPIGKATQKRVPKWMMNASREHLAAFINGYLNGDGNRGASTVAFTSSKRLADDLQEMALRAGMVANVRSRNRVGQQMVINGVTTAPTAIEYTVTFVTPSKYTPRTLKSKGRYKGWHRQMYAGKVYCVEVPTHVIYVRRNGVAMWCSQTYPELLSTTIKTWSDWFPPSICPIKREFPITGRMKMPLPDGTKLDMELVFLAVEREEDAKKLLSLELTGIWFNEAREIPWGVIQAAMGRIGRFPSMKDGGHTRKAAIADTNPPDDDSWWYKLAEDGRISETDEPVTKDEFEFFGQPSALIYTGQKYVPNPMAENVEHLTDGYRYYLDQIAGRDPQWVKVYILGQYGSIQSGKPVYGNSYNDAMHYNETGFVPIARVPVVLSFDFGLTPAAVFVQTTPRGQTRVIEEIIGENCGIRQLIENAVLPTIKTKYGKCPIFVTGDPAGKQRSQTDETTCYDIVEELLGEFIDGVEPAQTNDTQPRLDAVFRLLNGLVDGKARLQIGPDAPVLRKGFLGAYKYRQIAQGRTTTVPEKNMASHCFTGDTPVLTPTGPVEIQALTVGDLVITHEGPRKVVATMNRQVDELLTMTFSNGTTLRCTPDHPFMVNGERVRADSVRFGDVLEGIEWHAETSAQLPAPASRKIAVRLVEVKRQQRQERVYDLTVEGAHTFYAGGILVSNCHDAFQYACLLVNGGLPGSRKTSAHVGRVHVPIADLRAGY